MGDADGDKGLGAAEQRGSAPRRWRGRVITGVALLAVLAAAGVAGQQMKQGKQDEVQAPEGASGPELLAVPGEAPPPPVTVTVYQDLRGSASRAFAESYGDTLDAMAATGQVRIEYRLVTATDVRLGGRGSAEAAGAAACAQDEGRFEEYLDVLWRNQPAEDDDAFGAQSRLTGLAEEVPGLDPAVFRPCVKVRKHEGWVAASQREFAASGLGEAPVLTVAGRTVRPDAPGFSPDRLRRVVRTAVRDSGKDWSAVQGRQRTVAAAQSAWSCPLPSPPSVTRSRSSCAPSTDASTFRAGSALVTVPVPPTRSPSA